MKNRFNRQSGIFAHVRRLLSAFAVSGAVFAFPALSSAQTRTMRACVPEEISKFSNMRQAFCAADGYISRDEQRAIRQDNMRRAHVLRMMAEQNPKQSFDVEDFKYTLGDGYLTVVLPPDRDPAGRLIEFVKPDGTGLLTARIVEMVAFPEAAYNHRILFNTMIHLASQDKILQAKVGDEVHFLGKNAYSVQRKDGSMSTIFSIEEVEPEELLLEQLNIPVLDENRDFMR